MEIEEITEILKKENPVGKSFKTNLWGRILVTEKSSKGINFLRRDGVAIIQECTLYSVGKSVSGIDIPFGSEPYDRYNLQLLNRGIFI